MNIAARFIPHVVPAAWIGRTAAIPVKFMATQQRTALITDNMSVKDLAFMTDLNPRYLMVEMKKLHISLKKSGSLSIGDTEKLLRRLQFQYKYKNIQLPSKRPSQEPRPPVVAVMGHVDHGKTTLLDSLRKTAVAQSEAGGITQHIGAFSVSLSSGTKLTFLDTPGHAAFSNMRARGAQATDMVILVVAADDGVKEQTVESIRMIKEAKVPMVVAINKCDKHNKDITRVKQELLKAQVQLEEYGGEVQGVEISALKGDGLGALEDALLALSEIHQIKGDVNGNVQAVVIETRVDKGLGPMATLLIQHGTLRLGHYLVTGETWGKVRVMKDEMGRTMTNALPSSPVLTSGWKQLPNAGDICLQVLSEEKAKLHCEDYSALLKSRSSSRMPHTRSTPSQNTNEEVESDVTTVPLLVKGDVMGSVEALVEILQSRQPKEVALKVIHTGVGPVSEADLEMAFASKGIILAFGVSTPKSLLHIVNSKKVKIISNKVIYKLLDQLKSELEEGLGIDKKEDVLGKAEVIRVYHLTGSKAGTIGGSVVRQGKMLRSAHFRVERKQEVLHEGNLSGMRNEKQDISTANLGTEVGFKFAKDFDFEVGDKVVCYKKIEVKRSLNWDLGF